MRSLVLSSTAVAVMAIYLTYFGSSPELPYSKILALAQSHTHQSSENIHPLRGRVAIVTGCTSGLGLGIASELYHLGATVILASRSISKLKETEAMISSKYPSSLGELHILELDTSDLDSVQSFALQIDKQFPNIHYLVNNAGIHYASQGNASYDKSLTLESKQGFDLAFATNYLGHFLLTELLSSRLQNSAAISQIPSKIIQISSAAHHTSNGEMLYPSEDLKSMPLAAKPSGQDLSHRDLAYANNKLAQILHTQELNRRLGQSDDASRLRVVSVCPGWVATNIIPTNLAGRFISLLSYTSTAGALTALHGIVDDSIPSGSHLTNYFSAWTEPPLSYFLPRLLDVLGIRQSKPVFGFFALWVIFTQGVTYGLHISSPSPQARDSRLGSLLYQWSMKAVEQYASK